MAGSNVIMAAGTGNATANFKVKPGQVVQLVGFGFAAGADSLAVNVSYDGGTTYVPVIDDNGVAVALGGAGGTDVRNPVMLAGPGYYQVQRVATTAESVGASLVKTTID